MCITEGGGDEEGSAAAEVDEAVVVVVVIVAVVGDEGSNEMSPLFAGGGVEGVELSVFLFPIMKLTRKTPAKRPRANKTKGFLNMRRFKT